MAKAAASWRRSSEMSRAPASKTSQSSSRGSATATNSRSNRRAIDRANIEIASRLSVITSTSRLKSNRRASSSRRPMASCVRARATADRLLATRLTARNANSATQFCGSAIVNVPTGGRKKKLRLSIAATDVTTAIQSRDVAATTRTISRNVVVTIAAFETCNHLTNASVTPAMAARPAASRAASRMVRGVTVA